MRVKLFCGILAVSGNELVERSLPMCEEHSAWFGDTTGTISDGPDAYDATFKCRWKVDGMTANGRKNICIRFSQFDIEDSKRCDKTVVELSYAQSNQQFCQTLGEDRDRHRMMRSIGQRAFKPGNPRKARDGENFLTWTCLGTHTVTIQMASHPGANPAGNYLGFEMQWATESETTMATLKAEIDAHGLTLDFFNERGNRRIQKQFGRLMPKLNRTFKQGQVTCTATISNAPEFLMAAWNSAKSANTKDSLAAFLQEYTTLLHVGCYRRFNKIHDKLLGRFISNKLKL